MFQDILRILFASIFFINIFTPSLLQAQTRPLPVTKDTTQLKRNITLKIQDPATIYEREQDILEKAGILSWNAFSGPSSSSLLSNSANSNTVVDYTNSEIIWKAEEILELRQREYVNHSRDEKGYPLTLEQRNETYRQQLWVESEMYGGYVGSGPIHQRERVAEEMKQPITREKNILEEMFVNGDLNYGWIKYFISQKEEEKQNNLLFHPEHRAYFFDKGAMPAHVSNWYKTWEKKLDSGAQDAFGNEYIKKLLNKYSYRQSKKVQIAEASLYFMELLDPQEWKSFSSEEKEIVREEFSEIETLFKNHLVGIRGNTWEEVNARGSIRLALWNLYKFYYQTKLKQVSGMEAKFEDITEDLFDGKLMLRSAYVAGFNANRNAYSGAQWYQTGLGNMFGTGNTASTTNIVDSYKKHYTSESFPLAAKGSAGEKLCQEAINDVKKASGDEARQTATQYAAVLLMQARGHVFPLVKTLQGMGGSNLTSTLMVDTSLALEVADQEKDADSFRKVLFIRTLGRSTDPNFYVRTYLPVYEYAKKYFLGIPGAFGGPRINYEQLLGGMTYKKEKDIFTDSIGEAFCGMLRNADKNDYLYGLDLKSFKSVVSNLNSLYYLFFQGAQHVISMPGKEPRERRSCSKQYMVEVIGRVDQREKEEAFLSFAKEVLVWVVGGWAVGLVFKGAALVIRSSWIAVKATPKAVSAVNMARKGRKMRTAVIEYKKAFRYKNAVRSATKNSVITQTYTRGATAKASTTTAGATTAKAAQTGTKASSATGMSLTATQQGAKASASSASASAGASAKASATATKEVTKQVKSLSQLQYSDWNLFRDPKQLTRLTVTEYLPYQQQARIWSLTDESIALFNTKRGIDSYETLRQMRVMDQFGNTQRLFHQPLSFSRQMSFNPLLATQELNLTTQFIKNGGLRDLNLWGLSADGKLLQLSNVTDKTIRFNRLFAADQGFTRLAIENPGTFMRVAALPTKPKVGLIAELTGPLTTEGVALNFLQKGYGLSGRNYFSKVFMPNAAETLLTAEMNYIRSSFFPTLKFFGGWHIGNALVTPYMQERQEKAVVDLYNQAQRPYAAAIEESNAWGKALQEAQEQEGLAQSAMSSPMSLTSNLKAQGESEYLFPFLASGVGTALDYIDIWADIPLVGQMTDFLGNFALSVSQGIAEIPGGEYVAAPIILGGMMLKGSEPFKKMSGTKFSKEDGESIAAQYEHAAWNGRISANKIKRMYKKQVKDLYNSARESIFGKEEGTLIRLDSQDKSEEAVGGSLPLHWQEPLEDLLDTYQQDLLAAIEKPETANDISKITDKFVENRDFLMYKLTFEDYKKALASYPNQKKLIGRLDTAIEEINSYMATEGSMKEDDAKKVSQELNDLYIDVGLAQNAEAFLQLVQQQVSDPITQNYYNSYIQGFVQRESAGISSSTLEDKLSTFSDGFQKVDLLLSVQNNLQKFQLLMYYIPSIAENDEMAREMDTLMAQVGEFLKKPESVSSEKEKEVRAAYNALEARFQEAMAEEEKIALWKKDISYRISEVRRQVDEELSSWSNSTAIKNGREALQLFEQEANAIVEGEATIEEKNAQINESFAKLRNTLKANLAIKEATEELLPPSEVELNTQAY